VVDVRFVRIASLALLGPRPAASELDSRMPFFSSASTFFFFRAKKVNTENCPSVSSLLSSFFPLAFSLSLFAGWFRRRPLLLTRARV